MERQDYNFARLAYFVTKALHPKVELTVKDFMPKYGDDEEAPEQEQDLLKSKLTSMFMRMGGVTKRGDTS